MTKKQTEILAIIKTTLTEFNDVSKPNNINFSSFENLYHTLIRNFALYIGNEEDEKLKLLYEDQYRVILAYETKPNGINGVRYDYEKSIKIKASIKSKGVFENSLMVAAEHIAYDFNTFFNSIPQSPSN